MPSSLRSLGVILWCLPPLAAQAGDEIHHPLEPTRELILQQLRKSEATYDVKCWSSSKHIEAVLCGFATEGVAAHSKEEYLKGFIVRVWYFAQNLRTDRDTLTAAEIDEAFDLLVRFTRVEEENAFRTRVHVTGPRGYRGGEATVPPWADPTKPIYLTALDLADYRRTSDAWRALYAVVHEAGDLIHANLDAAALERLAARIDLYGLVLLRLAGRVAAHDGRRDLEPRDLELAAARLMHRYGVDGWSGGRNYVPRAYAQILAYVQTKIANLAVVNRSMSEEETLANVSKLARAPVPALAYARLEEVLRDLGARIWLDAQAEMQADQVYVSGRSVYEAIDRVLPYTLDEASNVRFFPDSDKPLLVRDFDCDTFRDDGTHWAVIRDLLETRGVSSNEPADGRDLMPPDVYATEELTEILSNYAVPLLRHAAELARQEGRGVIEPWDVDAAHAFFLGYQAAHGRAAGTSEGARTATPSSWAGPDPIFEDVTDAAGIAPIPEASLLHDTDMAQATLMAFDAFRGVSTADFDADGRPDLLVCEESEHTRLYRNAGDGTFEDVTQAAGLTGIRGITGAYWGDHDNDGDVDLYLLRVYRSSLLYENLGDGTFADVTEATGLHREGVPATGAVWFDADSDGDLDLYVICTGDFRDGFLPTRGDVENAEPNLLWRNRGDGTFEDATAEAGVGDRRLGLAVSATDYDNDGDLDLFIANDMQPNVLFRNQGDGTFVNVSKAAGVDDLGNGMGVSVADLDRDGWMDVYLTNINVFNPRTRYIRPNDNTRVQSTKELDRYLRSRQANRCYINARDGTFRDETHALFDVVDLGWGWNSFFFDFDNDGASDLYVINGFRPESIAHHDERNVLMWHDAALGRFVDVMPDAGFHGNSRGGVFFDYDADGDLDFVVSGLHGPRLFANRCESLGNRWLRVRLRGRESNRHGLGARLEVVARGADGARVVQHAEQGNQGGGFISCIHGDVHFGLGKVERVESVVVRWPSGRVQTVTEVELDAVLVVEEGE